ncbi:MULTISPECIES: type II secretion system protein [Dictyoglomus]|jgi:prepilin-type N-terminal cleavage/methylation domain-containing protein|uniref:Prepilin-type N-terminal cleavage/methylation domain protein n=1 Tax=Dictyoglomus turgidum (strain DSM 6724 / Z-1310) TaxID=515635 RepID=B8E077_DICTD|nr:MULTISPECIES: prepilin-type N-terminal cleavage/methylation domain-containing protein [Dictyoglomus]ACK42160.1 prepilin-type N-terminal cleavage/methylation domain protein [Dictyoglomus turgidum DSM 6724]PNV78998.1 MAG: prepilin-type cleavage/methylation domain-containing protein [Dictyoglomus turgidum]HBU32390.1 prepilin-type cleavage/methylation domain-containing protein [Dictyoglomus sp.]
MNKGGFSLIELLVVIVIISILALIGVSGYSMYLEKARESSAKSALKAIQVAVEMYSTDNKGKYPIANSLNELKAQILNYLPNREYPNNPYNNMPYSDENNDHYKITYTYDALENSYVLTVMDRYNIKRIYLLSNKITSIGE